jgi:hypothetical protein
MREGYSMKSLRWLNSFILLGVALIGLALAGFVGGGKFVFDPGRPSQNAPVFYLIAGVLMLVNGRLQPPQSKSKDH